MGSFFQRWLAWFQGQYGGGTGASDTVVPATVPEIDVSTGLLAMAALLAALAFAWEIRRRRKAV